jgi:hypothetical protein
MTVFQKVTQQVSQAVRLHHVTLVELHVHLDGAIGNAVQPVQIKWPRGIGTRLFHEISLFMVAAASTGP